MTGRTAGVKALAIPPDALRDGYRSLRQRGHRSCRRPRRQHHWAMNSHRGHGSASTIRADELAAVMVAVMALTPCGRAAYPIASSSTSNTSFAFAGISPGTPLSGESQGRNDFHAARAQVLNACFTQVLPANFKVTSVSSGRNRRCELHR
jgi:hypothetical protein